MTQCGAGYTRAAPLGCVSPRCSGAILGLWCEQALRILSSSERTGHQDWAGFPPQPGSALDLCFWLCFKIQRLFFLLRRHTVLPARSADLPPGFAPHRLVGHPSCRGTAATSKQPRCPRCPPCLRAPRLPSRRMQCEGVSREVRRVLRGTACCVRPASVRPSPSHLSHCWAPQNKSTINTSSWSWGLRSRVLSHQPVDLGRSLVLDFSI